MHRQSLRRPPNPLVRRGCRSAETHVSSPKQWDRAQAAARDATTVGTMVTPIGAGKSIIVGVRGRILTRGRVAAKAPRIAGGAAGLTDAQRAGILREAFQRKGNFGVGSATRADADLLGRDFVGPGFTRSRSNPDILTSADGLRKYRPPSFKPSRGGYQANLERRFESGGRFNSNAHIDILDP